VAELARAESQMERHFGDDSKKMGHRNEKVTLTVYIHLFNPDVNDADGLDDIWGKAS
jgi:hypothetical protein